MTLLPREVVSYLEKEEKKLILKNVLVIFSPRVGIFVLGLLEYFLSVLIIYAAWLKKKNFLQEKISNFGEVLESYDNFLNQYGTWSLFDRTILLFANTFMIIGHFLQVRTLLLPFQFWLPISVTINAVMQLSLLEDVASKWLASWFIIFFEVNSWICVLGLNKLLGFRYMVTSEYQKYRKRVFQQGNSLKTSEVSWNIDRLPTLEPIWLPHWPACTWTISLIFLRFVGGWVIS